MHEIFDILNLWIRKKFKDSFTTDGAGDTAIRVVGEFEAAIDDANTEEVIVTPLPVADTPVIVTLPTNTKRYTIWCRDRKKLLLGFNTGDIANGDYITIIPGKEHDSKRLDYVAETNIYLQSSSSNIDVEIHVQRKL